MNTSRVGNEPSASERATWHAHDDGSWDWGVMCEACRATPKEGGPGKVVNWNIRHLKTQNREGWTVREKEQEIWAEAKASGRDIERAR